MKKRTINTGGRPTPGLPFQGEWMVCHHCGKTQKSNPRVESGWTSVTLDDVRYYFCAECFRGLMAKYEASGKQ